MPLTADEEKELAGLEKQYGNQSMPSSGLSPDEEKELSGLEQKYSPSLFDKGMGFLLGAATHSRPIPGEQVQALGRGAKALGDTAWTSINELGAEAKNAATGNYGAPTGLTGDDFKDSLLGQGPSGGSTFQKVGVPAGPSLKDTPYIGGMLPDINARDAAGFVGKSLSDPAGIALGLVGGPASKALEGGGEKLYRSAFKNVDERLEEAGKKKMSDIMMENGTPTGSMEQIRDKTQDLANGWMKTRQAIYDQADKLGAGVSPKFNKAKAAIADLRYRGLDEQADKAEEILNGYMSHGFLSTDRASAMKSALWNKFKPEDVAGLGKFRAALGSDFKDEIAKEAERVGQKAGEVGWGDRISEINEDLGSTIEGSGPLDTEVRKEVRKNAFTPMDAALAVWHPKVEAAKKLVDLALTTGNRTRVGKGLMSVGKSGIVDPLAYKGLLDSQGR